MISLGVDCGIWVKLAPGCIYDRQQLSTGFFDVVFLLLMCMNCVWTIKPQCNIGILGIAVLILFKPLIFTAQRCMCCRRLSIATRYCIETTGRIELGFFGMESSFHLSSTVIKKYGYLQKLGYFLLGLVPNSGLRKFRHDHSNGKKYRRDFFCIIPAILVFGVWWGSVGPYSTVTLWILNWHDKLWKFTLNSSAH